MFKMGVAGIFSGLLLWGTVAQASLESNLLHTPEADALAVIETQASSWDFMLQREPFASAMTEFREDIAGDISEELGLDLDAEILPILGSHLSLAFYAGDSIPVLMAMDLKPGASAQAYARLVQRFQQKAKADPKKKLKQIKIGAYTLYGFQRTDRKQDPVYMTRTENTLLLGGRERLQAALEQQHTRSILKKPEFQSVYARLKQHKLWFYADPAGVSQALQMQKLDPDQWKATFNPYDSLGLGIDINPQGVLMRTVSQLKKTGLSAAQQTQVNALLKSWSTPSQTPQLQRKITPAQVLLFGQGAHLKNLWQMAQVFPTIDRESLAFQNQLKEGFKAFTGLDFERDILQPSDGNLSVAVFYPPGIDVFDRPPQMVLSIGAQNAARLRQNITQKLTLDVAALGAPSSSRQRKKNPPLRFFEKPTTRYSGIPLFTARPNKTAQRLEQALFVEPVLGQVGDLWLLASSMDAMKLSIDQWKNKAPTLNGNRYLSQLQQIHQLDPQMGTLFLDLRSLGAMLEYLAGEDEEIETMKPTMNAFRSVLVGAKHQDRVLETVAIVDILWEDVDFKMIQRVMR